MVELSGKTSADNQSSKYDYLSVSHPEVKLGIHDTVFKKNSSGQIQDDSHREIGSILSPDNIKNDSILLDFSKPGDYLNKIKQYIPDQIISDENYQEIQHVADYFNTDISSFFGFETVLSSTMSKSDYCIAISKNREREELLQILENQELPANIIEGTSWKNITNFTKEWANPLSIIHDQVLGLWFEFDTSESFKDLPIPNIFFHAKKIRIQSKKEEEQFQWIPQIAIPLLTGKKLQKNIEKKLIHSIKKLPPESSVFHFGAMLSRESQGIRIVIDKIKPHQLIDYLHSIGWTYETRDLIDILQELNKYVSRVVLHLNIGEKVDKKIGIECSFSLDKYHNEEKWTDFLDYLELNNLCIPEKKKALLQFIGADFSNSIRDLTIDQYKPSVMVGDTNSSLALVRYISHIKLVYNPDNSIIAKAYPGVRLLGSITKKY